MSETSPVYKGKTFAVLTHASFKKPINIRGNEIQTDFVTFTLDLPVSQNRSFVCGCLRFFEMFRSCEKASYEWYL
uniref:Uncharacterized protein n=1 Tax=Onchocerca volvulus TaxID=6282 RepID=A0A8R1TZ00_ONCVO